MNISGVEVALRWCPPGSFTMGSPSNEDGRDSDETQHRVTLTQGFWMGETEVTQALWQEVTGRNPSGAVTDPQGVASGDSRVLRGGSFWCYTRFCRSACRSRSNPDIRSGRFGFRLVAFQDGKGHP